MGEENNDLGYDILTLLDEEGNEHEFEMVDSVEHEGKEYVALIPVLSSADDLLEDSGELVIMRIAQEDGEEFLDSVEDDAEYSEISDIFVSRLSDDFEFDESED